MSVLSKEDLLKSIKDTIGDDTSDTALKLIEDINDTYDDVASKNKTNEDWKQKFEENDKSWRQKYRDRFFGGGNDSDDDDDDDTHQDDKAPKMFSDLFKED